MNKYKVSLFLQIWFLSKSTMEIKQRDHIQDANTSDNLNFKLAERT